MYNGYICKVTNKIRQIARKFAETLYFVKETKICNKNLMTKSEQKNAKFCII